jgi:hypothetical protein
MSSDPRALIGVLRNSHERLAGLVTPLTPDQLRAQSYDTEWTIAQVLSHLGSGAEIATLSLRWAGAASSTRARSRRSGTRGTTAPRTCRPPTP